MKVNELINALNNGAIEKYADLYADVEATKTRIIDAINAFAQSYGNEREVMVFSQQRKGYGGRNQQRYYCRCCEK